LPYKLIGVRWISTSHMGHTGAMPYWASGAGMRRSNGAITGCKASGETKDDVGQLKPDSSLRFISDVVQQFTDLRISTWLY
ncbi:hypothetical protein SUGI_0765210, partial [Cryptomeria japonica]